MCKKRDVRRAAVAERDSARMNRRAPRIRKLIDFALEREIRCHTAQQHCTPAVDRAPANALFRVPPPS
jgi:hypothetical protein